jgi:hypothetical protein
VILINGFSQIFKLRSTLWPSWFNISEFLFRWLEQNGIESQKYRTWQDSIFDFEETTPIIPKLQYIPSNVQVTIFHQNHGNQFYLKHAMFLFPPIFTANVVVFSHRFGMVTVGDLTWSPWTLQMLSPSTMPSPSPNNAAFGIGT